MTPHVNISGIYLCKVKGLKETDQMVLKWDGNFWYTYNIEYSAYHDKTEGWYGLDKDIDVVKVIDRLTTKSIEWYIGKYESYSCLSWKLLEFMFNKLVEVRGRDYLLQLKDNEDVKSILDKMKRIEDDLNKQLKIDLLDNIESSTWENEGINVELK